MESAFALRRPWSGLPTMPMTSRLRSFPFPEGERLGLREQGHFLSDRGLGCLNPGAPLYWNSANLKPFGQKQSEMPNKETPERSELFRPGQSFGKFYLVQLVGEGGTSRIFKALQQPINRLVALKIPSFPRTGAILTPDEFLTEATLMGRLDHNNVIRIFDFGVHEDSAFICMEYVDGINLQEWTEGRGPLSLSAALAVGRQTLEGLRHSHSRGVLHLNLSPA